MKLIPAIDLRGGKVVRLYQGDFARETIYGDDPPAQARLWQQQGANALHVVDLDGARGGGAINSALIAEICRAVSVPVQVGGGMRSLAAVEAMLRRGVSRVVLGTLAVEEPEKLQEALGRWGEQIAVALDARDGVLTTHGWQGTTALNVITAATMLASRGVRCLIYTNISRDGTLTGPDVSGLRAIQAAVGGEIELIASGGIATADDLLRLQTLGVSGAIVGKALYTGDIILSNVRQLLSAAENDSDSRSSKEKEGG